MKTVLNGLTLALLALTFFGLSQATDATNTSISNAHDLNPFRNNTNRNVSQTKLGNIINTAFRRHFNRPLLENIIKTQIINLVRVHDPTIKGFNLTTTNKTTSVKDVMDKFVHELSQNLTKRIQLKNNTYKENSEDVKKKLATKFEAIIRHHFKISDRINNILIKIILSKQGLNNTIQNTNITGRVRNINIPPKLQQAAAEGVKHFVKKAGEKFTEEMVPKVVDPIVAGIDDGVEWTGTALKDAGEWTGTAVKDAGEWTGTAVKDAGEWTGTAVKDAGEWTATAAEDAGKWTNTAFNDVGDWTSTAAEDTGKALSDFASSINVFDW